MGMAKENGGMATELCVMKSFNQKVYEIVRRIPKGYVMTYGQIARLLGKPMASRAVGYAMYAVAEENLPCHRVVFKDGSLAKDFVFGGKDKQYLLLKSEGITFNRGRKIKMEKHLWDATEIEAEIFDGAIF